MDLIVIYNSGRFRMAGRGSLAGLMPYADANAVVMDMAREVRAYHPQTQRGVRMFRCGFFEFVHLPYRPLARLCPLALPSIG